MGYLTEDTLTEEKQPSIDWRRIYALPFNHFFEEKVREKRLSLGLPTEGISNNAKASEWLHNHLGLQKPFLPNVVTIPLWIALLPLSPNGELRQTSIRLWQCSFKLADEFGLPVRMYRHIGLYILTNNESLLTSWTGLDTTFAISRKFGRPQFTITVDGLDVWTTERQWLDVWKHFVKPLRQLLGEVPRGRRQAQNDKLKEQITRWAHLYQIIVIEKVKDPDKALGILQQRYPDEAERWRRQKGSKEQTKDIYDATGVYYAIEEFKKLIAPISH